MATDTTTPPREPAEGDTLLCDGRVHRIDTVLPGKLIASRPSHTRDGTPTRAVLTTARASVDLLVEQPDAPPTWHVVGRTFARVPPTDPNVRVAVPADAAADVVASPTPG